MKKIAVIYIHGKGGNAAEAEHYKPFFPECHVIGFDYMAQTPWEAVTEFEKYFADVSRNYSSTILIANSIGAFFAINALSETRIEKAFFISPIVDMEMLITNMMQWAGVTESELRERKEIETDFGETLSWEYLSWVRSHPIRWNVPTSILYGGLDRMQSFNTIKSFADSNGAEVTVMENGEHWFHTEEQMSFLDHWIGKLA